MSVRNERLHRWWRRPNIWIGAVLIGLNLFAWFVAFGRGGIDDEWVIAEPTLHPEIAEIRANWQSGDAAGESFRITVTDQMAMETIAWFVEPPPDLPFSTPQVRIHEGYVEGGGVLKLAGLQMPVLGRANVWLENGKVTGEVTSLTVSGAAAPRIVVQATDQAKAIYDDLSFPIEITYMELREGEVYLEGVYR